MTIFSKKPNAFRMSVPIGFVLLFLSLPQTRADVYYVDAVNGSDSNSGALDQPFQTLGKVQTLDTSGTTAYLMAGTYTWTTETNKTRTDWFKVKAYTGHTPTITGLVQSTRYPVVMADTYLWFENIVFTGKLNLGHGRYWKIVNCTVTGTGYDVANDSPNVTAIKLTYCDQVTIDGVTITGTGNGATTNSYGGQAGSNFGKAFFSGIDCYYSTAMPCTNVTIQNCTVLSCRDAITVAGNDYTVKDNTISYFTDNGLTLVGANEDSGTACLVERNTVRYGGRFNGNHVDLIQFNGANGSHNLIYKNVTLRNNIFSDSDYQGMFLRTDSSESGNWLIENNLVYNTDMANGSSYAARMFRAVGITFRNNTIVKGPLGGGGSGTVTFESNGGQCVITSVHNNIIDGVLDLYAALGVEVLYENNNIIKTKGWPVHMGSFVWGNKTAVITDLQMKRLFRDYANSKFDLASDSFAKDYCSQDKAPQFDIRNRQRDSKPDAGCYEYFPTLNNTFDGRENWLSLIELNSTDLSGNPITFSPTVAGLPKRAAFNPATYTLSWQPWYNQAGSFELLFSAVGSDYIEMVTINVEDVPLTTWYQTWIEDPNTLSAMVEY